MSIFRRLKNKVTRQTQKIARVLTGDRHLGFHWSQFGEDCILLWMFPRTRRGFYVDIGAHHPRRWSNTRLLNLRNWRGINVDANAGAIEVFRRERPGDVNLHCAVAEKEGIVQIHQFADHAIDTLSPAQAAKYGGAVRTIEVPAVTLNGLLAKHLPQGQRIDLMNVDVEGMDFEILKGLDFDRYDPEVICVEIHDVDFDALTEDPTYRLLRSRGYKMVSFCWFTAIFRKEAEPQAAPS